MENKIQGLSILIAIYNWDVTRLVNDLVQQAAKLDIDYEIILLDDASEHDYQLKNAKLDFLPQVTYLQNYFNVGRSVIRNTLASKAQYPYLLFMDCDVTVTHDDYIKNYVDFIENEKDTDRLVVSGGTAYSKKKPQKDCILRWKYGRKMEQKNACERSINPNYAFTSFNFLISKKIFERIEFNESISEYGHEDTLFGIELMENGIVIKHIDNPLQHDGVHNTTLFLKQTENSIDNLLLILNMVANKEKFIEIISLLRCYEKMKNRNRLHCFTKIYACFAKLIERNLHSKHPSIIFFNFYKLNYLIHQIKNQ